MRAMQHRPRPSSLFLTLVLGLGLGTLAGGCGDDDDEIGTPCESDEDCSGDLLCDVHEGQGTCQEPHDH
jgi:hypothetical protein